MPRASALATRQIRHRRASSACCGAHCRCAAGVQAQTRLRARGARRRARRGRRAARRGRRARSGLGRRCVYKCTGLCAGRIRQPGQQGFRWGRDGRQDLRRGAFHHATRGGPLGDATGNNLPVAKLVANVEKEAAGDNSCCVLMHDLESKSTTVEALPQIIQYFIDQGYTFDALTASSCGYHF